MRIVPSLTFIHDALPENARHLDEVLARARELDEELAARRSAGATYAGDADPYKKPHEPGDEPGAADGDDETVDG
jgi:ribosome-binding factor A